MTQSIQKLFPALLFGASLFAACKKDNPPVPDEQELITTLQMRVSNQSMGFSKSFIYKVQNGFNSPDLGGVQIDTLRLEPNVTYDVILVVKNEQADPVEDITNEIIQKSTEHLFVFSSDPADGAGSLKTHDGSKDANGAPLNQNFQLTTGAAGSGSFGVMLMHQPTNKNGQTAEQAGGETDLQAVFPVRLE